MAQLLSNRAKVAEAGFTGEASTDPFQNVPLDDENALLNFFATKRAIVQDTNFDGGIPPNDLLNAWRTTYNPASLGATSRSLVSLSGPGFRGALDAAANQAQQGAYRGTATVIDSGGVAGNGLGLRPTTSPTQIRFPTAAAFANGIGAVGLFLIDPSDDTGYGEVFIRSADNANRLAGRYTAAATPTLAMIREVAGVETTEVTSDRTALDEDTLHFVAVGLRSSGTTYSLFQNGRRVSAGTLNAASQGLTGNGVGFGLGGVRNTLVAFDAFALSA